MKELLNDQKILKKSNTGGPLQEIASWKSRSANLLDISKQLQKPEVRHVQNILQLSKSMYLQRFSKLAEEVQVKNHLKSFVTKDKQQMAPFCRKNNTEYCFNMF